MIFNEVPGKYQRISPQTQVVASEEILVEVEAAVEDSVEEGADVEEEPVKST